MWYFSNSCLKSDFFCLLYLASPLPPAPPPPPRLSLLLCLSLSFPLSCLSALFLSLSFPLSLSLRSVRDLCWGWGITVKITHACRHLDAVHNNDRRHNWHYSMFALHKGVSVDFRLFYASTLFCHHLPHHPHLRVYVQLSNLKLSPVEGDEEVELPTFTAEDLAAAVTNDMKFEITVQEEKLAQMKPNMAAIAEYRKKVRWLSLIRSIFFFIWTFFIASALYFS